MSPRQKLAAAVLALLILLFGVPWAITLTGRDDLYYTLTSVALLSIASAGVWLTFYIGRINIGQGAYALIGGYTAAILVVDGGLSFWLALPLAVFKRFGEHGGGSLATTISYWSFFSIFPLLLAFVTILNRVLENHPERRQQLGGKPIGVLLHLGLDACEREPSFLASSARPIARRRLNSRIATPRGAARLIWSRF